MIRKHFLRGSSVAIIVFLTAAPVIYLLLGSVFSVISGKTQVDLDINFSLLLNTIGIDLSAALLAIVLGAFAAVGIWTFFEKHATKTALFLILLILVPPFIHVQSWIYFVDKINAFLAMLFGSSQNFSGIFALILTLAFSYLPITAGLALLALQSVPPEIADLCLLERGSAKVFFKVYFPLTVPALLIGGLLIFLLNVNDYSIPSVFGVNVFALELFSRFSAGGNIYAVFIYSIPLLLICIATMIGLGKFLSRSEFSFSAFSAVNPFKKDKVLNSIGAVGLVIMGFFVLVPVLNLLYETLVAKNILLVLFESLKQFSFSIFTSSVTALVCVVPAVMFAYLVYKLKPKMRVVLLVLTALPFLIPSAIGGLAMIEMYNTPFLRFIYQSPLITAIALVSKYTFIEAIVLSVAVLRVDKALLDNLQVHYGGVWGTFKCLVALFWRECIAGVLIVFALSICEFGMTLLVSPPGYQTITIKIYNYLHYGASDIVATLCLAILVVVMIILSILFAIFSRVKGED